MSVDQRDALVEAARRVAEPGALNDRFTFGGVGAAVLAGNGAVYVGVCVDTSCSMGMCAEVNAISTMLTAGQTEVRAMVAVTRNGRVIPACGKCREFVSQMGCDPEVVVDETTVLRLSELLPRDWKSC